MGMEILTCLCPPNAKIWVNLVFISSLFFVFFFFCDFCGYFRVIFYSQVLLHRFMKFFMDLLIHIVVTLWLKFCFGSWWFEGVIYVWISGLFLFLFSLCRIFVNCNAYCLSPSRANLFYDLYWANIKIVCVTLHKICMCYCS